MNSLIHTSFLYFFTESLDATSRSGISGSKGKCICHFADITKLPSIETTILQFHSNMPVFPKTWPLCRLWGSGGADTTEKWYLPTPIEMQKSTIYTVYILPSLSLFLHVKIHHTHTHSYTYLIFPLNHLKSYKHTTLHP